MDPSIQITIAAIGSVCSTITALAIVAILMRLLGEQQDSQILCEIRLLREEMRQALSRPLLIQRDGDTQHLLSVIPGHVNVGGGIELHKAYPNYAKYRGLDIEVHVIAKNQHEMMREGG